MIVEFDPKFVPVILNGQKGFTLRNKRTPMPAIGEQICMTTLHQVSVITPKHVLKGIDTVRIIIVFKNLRNNVLIILNERPLSQSESMLFYFLNGFNSPQDFCDYWLKGAKEIDVTKYMYRWIDLPF